MQMSLTAGASLALALLVGCVDAADGLKSGPQVGDSVGIFEPLYVTGASAGQKRCPV
ncbi:MAG TPA: hypothetical protein VKA46_11790 [Gemmataceae bacterium]|nr:hypothetical protein [Gemmataceae bacterium]